MIEFNHPPLIKAQWRTTEFYFYITQASLFEFFIQNEPFSTTAPNSFQQMVYYYNLLFRVLVNLKNSFIGISFKETNTDALEGYSNTLKLKLNPTFFVEIKLLGTTYNLEYITIIYEASQLNFPSAISHQYYFNYYYKNLNFEIYFNEKNDQFINSNQLQLLKLNLLVNDQKYPLFIAKPLIYFLYIMYFPHNIPFSFNAFFIELVLTRLSLALIEETKLRIVLKDWHISYLKKAGYFKINIIAKQSRFYFFCNDRLYTLIKQIAQRRFETKQKHNLLSRSLKIPFPVSFKFPPFYNDQLSKISVGDVLLSSKKADLSCYYIELGNKKIIAEERNDRLQILGCDYDEKFE